MSGNQMILLGGSQAPAVDPYFYSVTSLLHGDGTNGAQNNTFLDSSTNNFTITRNGNTTQGSFSPFSQTGWSNYFDGNADFLNFTKQSTTSSVTCECWFYRGADTSGGYHIVFGGSNAATVNPDNVQMVVSNAGAVGWYSNSGWIILQTGTAVARNQWSHIAWVRSGTSCAIFVNGFRIATGTNSAALNIDRIGTAGGIASGAYDSIGYISNARINTTAVYDPSLTTCTVPVAPLTAISGTYLLTCQSNRFVDNSASPLTITRNGDVSVQPFSPFNPTTAYSTSSVGGSGYFDGSGDYLTLASNAAFGFGTGDFTVEAWVYINTATSYANIVAGPSGGTTWYMEYSSTRGFYFYDGATALNGNSSVVTGQWVHLAVARSGTSLKMFVNGAVTATYTNSQSVPQIAPAIGAYNDGTYLVNGYISNLRLVKGTAVYTATFTPPTSPLTAITNTSLLLNFTNAGIFDNAADADYETVGNAQISTSVKKYGTGSMAFDGTGDYLTSPFSRQWRLLNDDFTIEMWVYLSASQANMGLVSSYTSNNGWLVRLDTSAIVFSYGTGSSATVVSNSASLSTGVWYHLAWCKIGSSLKAYVNGTQVGSTATISSPVDNSTTGLQVGRTHTVTNDFNGYIDDLRISKGVGRYPYNFTPPTAEFPNIGGTVTLIADPYYDYTTLLLPGNGTNGAQNNTFLDSSTNNFTITRNGNTTQGTFSPFSQTGWGNYFDGTGDYLDAGSSTAFGLGTGDFTIEMWVYPTANPANGPGTMFDLRTGVTATACASRIDSSLNLLFYNGPANTEITVGTVALNTWTQIAFVRSSGTLKTYVNGTQINSSTVSGDLGTTQACWIAANRTAGYNFNGYISNFRIVKGTAVYTANFTPPTTPLTAVSGTSILTCQSNRFVDNSSNAFAITRNGDVSVQAFSPFNPTAAWSAATYGGSGYFDGSGDYLTVANSANYALGTSDFTIELWWYPTASFSSGLTLFSHGYVSYCPWLFYTGSSNTLLGYASSSGSSWDVLSGTNFGTVTINAWNHIALCRSGSTFYLCLNGVVTSTATSSASLMSIASGLTIGATTSGIGIISSSYITNARIIKGTALYTGAYTLPTAPLTPVTNTQFLLSATNAGILDATSKNDLETVGNAQISTTQSKFGGSSMYFDGTGDYLNVTRSPSFAFGTGDFTIEGWIYILAAGDKGVFQQGTSYFPLSSSNSVALGINNSGTTWQIYAKNTNANSTATYALNTWTHFALVRFGTTTTLYINGASAITVTADSTNYTGEYLGIGAIYGTSTTTINAYIDDFRVTKGIARYTSNFTPPTTAFLTL